MRSMRPIPSGTKRRISRTIRQATWRGIEPLEPRRLLASIVVNSAADDLTPDDGFVTLREAITAANNDSTTDTGQTGDGADEITFNLGAGLPAIDLMTELPALDSDLAIVGPGGAEDLTVRRDVAATEAFRIFTVLPDGDVTLENLTVANGDAGTSPTGVALGGGILNWSGVLAVRGCSIVDNQAHLGGGIANEVGGVLDVSDTSLLRNTSNTGGALSNVAEAVATLTRCEIAGNYAAFSGGAVYNALLSTLTINDSSVDFNASYDAGGIDNVDGSTLHLANSTFTTNSASDYGGAVRNQPTCTTTIDGCTFSYNSSSHGGAVFNFDGAVLDVADSTFTGNVSYFGGGGAIDNGGVETVQRCTFEYNSASFGGGALWNHIGAGLTVVDSTFNYNSAGEGGAIANREDASLNLQGCTFTGNFAQYWGGAIYNLFGGVVVADCTFTGNGATDGGAINNDGGPGVTVTRSTFAYNNAYGGGGALWSFVNSTMSVSDCTFTGNSANEGGAINSRENAVLTVERSSFDLNMAWTWGGGIFNVGGSAAVADCTFTHNNALEGGAINNTGSASVTGSLFADNTAFSRGGALYNWFTGSMDVMSSTVHHNGAYEGGGLFNYGVAVLSFATFTDNYLIEGELAGAGAQNDTGSLQLWNTVIARSEGPDVVSSNLDFSHAFSFIGDAEGDPMLEAAPADNGGPTLTMALLPGSPLINAGDPDFVGPPNFDQRGTGFGRLVGERIDIGAFEYNTAPTIDGLPDLTVPEDAPDSLINLRDSFDDAEDGPDGLVYTIVGNTNPALFASASIDGSTDTLTFDWAADAHGVGDITVRATDPGGLSVESTFTVTVLSVGQQADLLVQQVNALPSLNLGNRNSLLGKLNLKGNGGDADKVGSFIDQVGSMVESGKISGTDGDALIAAAEDLIESLA